MPEPIITLTTDFGHRDQYVATMKGVVLTICPQAVLIDISHEVRPQAIRQAAYLLASAAPFFPRGTVHVAVIDPGVGTERCQFSPVSVPPVFGKSVPPFFGNSVPVLFGKDVPLVFGQCVPPVKAT
jgi:hypothetical protein